MERLEDATLASHQTATAEARFVILEEIDRARRPLMLLGATSVGLSVS